MFRYKQGKVVIPAKAGIQAFYQRFLDSCLRRSDNTSVPLFFIQEAINKIRVNPVPAKAAIRD
jgi:hypothetical protein